MKRRLLAAVATGGLLAAMVPGAVSADPPQYSVMGYCDEPELQQALSIQFQGKMGEWKKAYNTFYRKVACVPGSIEVTITKL